MPAGAGPEAGGQPLAPGFERIEPGKGPGERIRQSRDHHMLKVYLTRGFMHFGKKMVQNHQHPAAGIVQLISDLRGAQQGIQENRHPSQGENGVVGRGQLGAVGQEHGQAVARPQAQVLEGPGQAPHLVQKLAVGGFFPEKNQG